jgi:cobyrinic acid a,c-diamide synthase
MITSTPRLVVSGLRGGSGKTILSLSLIASLKKKGKTVIPFKKGPDYIDAGWLAQAAGLPCYNLDLFMMTPDQARRSFREHSRAEGVAVVEGNRGLYDGVDHEGTYSTAALSKLLKAPVIIIMDCTKSTNTVAAMLLGCQKMDPDVVIGGVVLNRVATARQESVIRKAIARACGIPVLGAIPRLKRDPFPERHMGLTPFQEHEGIGESIETVAGIGENYLDLDAVMDVAGNAGTINQGPGGRSESTHSGGQGSETDDELRITNYELTDDVQRGTGNGVRIGIIRDSAFQFYYQENFEELEKRGATLVEASPLQAKELPDIDALYIGGGFPETHAVSLAENRSFRYSLYSSIQRGLPVYAECGGLMYLGKNMVLDNISYPMVGALPVTFGLEKRPRAHGYTIVEVTNANAYFPERTVLRGHEFHYSHVLDIDRDAVTMAFDVKRGKGIVENKDGMCHKNVLATYTHLHALGSPEWVEGMISAAETYKIRKTDHE